MDVSSTRLLSELDMEEPTFIELSEIDPSRDYYNFHSFPSKSYSSFQAFDHKATDAEVGTYTGMERPVKQLKNDRWKSYTNTEQGVTPKASSSPSSSQLISFGNSKSQLDYCTIKPKDEEVSPGNMDDFPAVMISQVQSSYQATENQRQDHVFAERMRREKLSQRFIALTALIPDLKKADKASVLGEAAKYLKRLQERVKTLEELTAKNVVESVVFVKKSRLSFESDHDNYSSSDENFECKPNQLPPEIEARVSDRDVLIRIHCDKQKGYVAKVLSEMEKLHLTVTNSSVLPFGNHAIDITVVSQMDTGYCMTVKDLVKNLRQSVFAMKTM